MNLTKSLSKPCPSPKEFLEDTILADLKILHQVLSVLSDFENVSSSYFDFYLNDSVRILT